jgi:hypothetical protein
MFEPRSNIALRVVAGVWRQLQTTVKPVLERDRVSFEPAHRPRGGDTVRIP